MSESTTAAAAGGPITAPLSRSGVAAMATAGSLAILGAAEMVLKDGPPTADYTTVGGLLHEFGTLAFFAATAWSALAAAQSGWAPRRAARLIALGYGLIALGVAFGLVLRDDPEWFFLLGGPGNLLGGIGFVWWAVAGWRSRTLPGWAALLCGFGGVTGVLGGELGLTALIGVFWLWLARRGAAVTTTG